MTWLVRLVHSERIITILFVLQLRRPLLRSVLPPAHLGGTRSTTYPAGSNVLHSVSLSVPVVTDSHGVLRQAHGFGSTSPDPDPCLPWPDLPPPCPLWRGSSRLVFGVTWATRRSSNAGRLAGALVDGLIAVVASVTSGQPHRSRDDAATSSECRWLRSCSWRSMFLARACPVMSPQCSGRLAVRLRVSGSTRRKPCPTYCRC